MAASSSLYLMHQGKVPVAKPTKVIRASMVQKGLKPIDGGPGGYTLVSGDAITGVTSSAYMATRQILPQGGISGVLVGQNVMIDLKLSGPSVSMDFSTLHSYECEIVVQNNDGVNAATVLPAVYMLNQMELVIDGGVAIPYGTARMIERRYLQTMANREWQAKFPIYGYSTAAPTTAYAGVTIPAGGSRTFRIPLQHVVAFLRQAPCMQAITSEVIFRLYFKPASLWCYSNSLSKNLQCTNIRMMLSGHCFEPAAAAALRAATIGHEVLLAAIYPQNRSNTFGALGANAYTSYWTLQQKGWVAQFAVDIYGAAPTDPEDVITNLASFQKFTFKDGNGAIINNGWELSSDMYSYVGAIYGKASPPAILPLTVADGSVLGYSGNLYYPDAGPCLPFCDEIVDILADRKRFGSYAFRGGESIQIQAPAAGYPGSMVAQFYFDQVCVITQSPTGRLLYSVPDS